MDEELKEELKQCNTLNEMWIALDEWYDLDTPLGTVTKAIVVQAFIKNFGKIIELTQIPEREIEEEQDAEGDSIPQ